MLHVACCCPCASTDETNDAALKPAAKVDFQSLVRDRNVALALMKIFTESYRSNQPQPVWETAAEGHRALRGLVADDMEVLFRTMQHVLRKLQVATGYRALLGDQIPFNRFHFARMALGLASYSEETLNKLYDVACLHSIITITGLRATGRADDLLLWELGGTAIRLTEDASVLLAEMHDLQNITGAEGFLDGNLKSTQNTSLSTEQFLLQNIKPEYQTSFASRHRPAVKALESAILAAAQKVEGYQAPADPVIIPNLLYTEGSSHPQSCHTAFKGPYDRKTLLAFTPVSRNGCFLQVWKKEGKEPEDATPTHIPFGVMILLPPQCLYGGIFAFDAGMDEEPSALGGMFNLRLLFLVTEKGGENMRTDEYKPPDLSHPYSEHKLEPKFYKTFRCIFHLSGAAPPKAPPPHASLELRSNLQGCSPVPSNDHLSDVGSANPNIFDIGLKPDKPSEHSGDEQDKPRPFQARTLRVLKNMVPDLATVEVFSPISTTAFWSVQSKYNRGASAMFKDLVQTADGSSLEARQADATNQLRTYRLFLLLVKQLDDFAYQHLLASETVTRVWKLHVLQPSYEQDCAILLGNRFTLRYRMHHSLTAIQCCERAQITANTLRRCLTDPDCTYVDEEVIKKLVSFEHFGIKWRSSSIYDLLTSDEGEDPGDDNGGESKPPASNPAAPGVPSLTSAAKEGQGTPPE